MQATTTILQFLSYEQAYFLAAFVGILLVLLSNWNRSFPYWEFTLITLLGFAFYLIGTNLAAIPLEGWKNWWQEGDWHGFYGRNEVGGILLLPIGVLLGHRLLGLRGPVLDYFALAIPLAALIYRQGCLAAGCCFGTTTDSWVGMTFAPDSLVFMHQVHSGQIPEFGLSSLPVHPTQVYFMLGALFTLLIAIVFWKKIPTGRRYFFVAAVFLVFRFVVDFFLAPAANPVLGFEWGFLKAGQWGLLGLIGIFFWLTFRRKRIGARVRAIPNKRVPQVMVLLLLLGLYQFFGQHMPHLENLAFSGLLGVSILGFYIFFPIGFRKNVSRWGASLVFILSIFFMGQSNPGSYSRFQENEIKLGYEFSTDPFVVREKVGERRLESACGWDRIIELYDYLEVEQVQSTSLMTEIRFPNRINDNLNGVGLGINYSIFKLRDLENDLKEEISSFVFNGLYTFDHEDIGFRVGFSGGGSAGLTPQGDSITSFGLRRNLNFYPALGFRIGQRHKIDGRFGWNAYYPMAPSWQRVHLSGGVYGPLFGWKNRSGIRLGFDRMAIGVNTILLQADFSIKNYVIISPLARIGKFNSYGLHLRVNWREKRE